MTFNKFESECVGVAIDDWPHLMVGIFHQVDADWAVLLPIPPENPLSRTWKFVDSDLYIRLKDVKLIKLIKYGEQKSNPTQSSLFDPDVVAGASQASV